MAAILEREPAPISTLQPIAPPALDHVVHTCLAKDPDELRHRGIVLGNGYNRTVLGTGQ